MEIKEIIAQFEEKRQNIATDLSCLENLEKAGNLSDPFNVQNNCSIVLLDRDADFVKTIFNKYVSVIEILKTGVNFNTEDIFHFAEYRIDGSHTITKNIYEVDGLNINFRGNYCFHHALIRSISWNVKTNYVGETRGKSRRSIPLRVNQPWNHKPGSKHTFVNAETLRQELMVQLMETAKYYAVIDYLHELERVEADMKSINRYVSREMHVNLAWNELLKAKSMTPIDKLDRKTANDMRLRHHSGDTSPPWIHPRSSLTDFARELRNRATSDVASRLTPRTTSS